MYSRLGELGEDASDKLEDVEVVAVGVLGEGVVVRCFSLVARPPSYSGGRASGLKAEFCNHAHVANILRPYRP
jgi:hypothetical protein